MRTEHMSGATYREQYVDIPQPKNNKYNAIAFEGPTSDGSSRKYHSMWEAKCASNLMYMQLAGEITEFETQYKIEWTPYSKEGYPVESLKVTHAVDFRAHLPDGSYLLVEAKGAETSEYKKLKKIISVWLSENLDHEYVVWKDRHGKSKGRKIQSRGWRKYKPQTKGKK